MAACAVGAFLIDYAGGHVSRMQFDSAGCLTDFGMDRFELDALVAAGKPFQTSGCPGHGNEISACNRPYGDSMPADIRSFPFALNVWDVALVRRQMRGGTMWKPIMKSHKLAPCLLNLNFTARIFADSLNRE
jgi:biotin synthase